MKVGLPKWLRGKESTCQCRRCGFDPCVEKVPWRRKWQPTPVFLLAESHGQRSLAGYSPWGCKRVRHDLATKTQQTAKGCSPGDRPLERAENFSEEVGEQPDTKGCFLGGKNPKTCS